MTGARLGAALLCAAMLLSGCGAAAGQRGKGSPSRAPKMTRQRPGTPVPAAASSPAPPAADPDKVADRSMAAVARALPAGAVSVAVRNVQTGDEYEFGADRGMWAGSVYKLLVLEALLLERQRTGSWFSSEELADISAMIEQSDNAAGYRMYLDAGGSAALAAAARRLGLRHTVIGRSDPAFTTMAGRDGITLLSRLIDRGPLTRRSRAFVLHLMHRVQADQRWGAGVLADPDSSFANKNGWLEVDDSNGPGEDDGGRWLVNSLGLVRVHGQRLLVAIFTRHDPDRDAGIELVEDLARIAAPAVLASR